EAVRDHGDGSTGGARGGAEGHGIGGEAAQGGGGDRADARRAVRAGRADQAVVRGVRRATVGAWPPGRSGKAVPGVARADAEPARRARRTQEGGADAFVAGAAA